MNTKIKTERYNAPESVTIDIESGTVLCASPSSGSSIDDFEKLPGDWE